MGENTKKLNFEKIKLDRFYDLVVESKNAYTDNLGSILDILIAEKEMGKINEDEFKFLLKLLLVKEIKQEGKDINNWITTISERQSTSMLINISSNEKRYA